MVGTGYAYPAWKFMVGAGYHCTRHIYVGTLIFKISQNITSKSDGTRDLYNIKSSAVTIRAAAAVHITIVVSAALSAAC